MAKFKECILFTNLEYVTVGPVRTMCYALLLEKSVIFEENYKWVVRGFGTEAAWPVFDMSFSDEIDFTTEPQQVSHPSGQKFQPSGRMTLKITDKREGKSEELALLAHNLKKPISVEFFRDVEVPWLWRHLASRVRDCWQPPHMPSLRWGPPWGSQDPSLEALQKANTYLEQANQQLRDFLDK